MKKFLIATMILASTLTFAQAGESDSGLPPSAGDALSTAEDQSGGAIDDTGDEYADYYDDEVYGYLGDSGGGLKGIDGIIAMSGGIAFVVFMVIFYATCLILPYVVGSYGLARLDMHYQNVSSSGVSWIPFYRYYHILYNATHSKSRAFFGSFSLLLFMVLVAILTAINMASVALGFNDLVLSIILGVIGFCGFLTVIACHFWKAFIIKDYVKGDITTAFGLSTYTGLVLWYLGLERSTGKTDIIGKIGFIIFGLIALLYIVLIVFALFAGAFANI